MVRGTESGPQMAVQTNIQWPSVTIYVLNWNGRTLLASCLPPLARLDYPDYEIVLIDNHSDDDSVAWTRENFPDTRIIQNDDNLGFSKGMNVGLRCHRKEIAVLLNTDVETRPDWLKELVRPIAANPTVGITGSKLYFGDGRTLQHAGAMIEWPLGIGRHRFYREEDTGQADTECVVDYVTGASMAIARPVLETIGVFDEDFAPFYYEETDFCLRAKAADFQVVYAPRSVAIHHESMTFRQFDRPLFHNLQRNRLLFLLKHVPPDAFLRELPPAEKEFMAGMGAAEALQTMRRIYLEMMFRLPDVLPARGLEPQTGGYQDVLTDLAGTAVTLAQRRAMRQGHLPLMNENPLAQKSQIKVESLQSAAPVIGPLVAAFRNLWGNVAARWLLVGAFRQQNEFNRLTAVQWQLLDKRLADQDRELVTLTRQVAELRIALCQTQKHVRQLEAQLSPPEEAE